MKRNKLAFGLPLGLFFAFALWTVAILWLDVRPIGPQGSSVGLASLNEGFHRLTGVHWALYNVTDWLGLVPLAVCLGFGLFGLFQWIKRKSIAKVDRDLLLLGAFYILTVGAYLFFERVPINYRPVMINGCLEASYPSSTTLLVLCVMSTALQQLRRRLHKGSLRTLLTLAIYAFIVCMVAGRLISGVHWLTDIVGGGLLSAAMVTLYRALCQRLCHRP